MRLCDLIGLKLSVDDLSLLRRLVMRKETSEQHNPYFKITRVHNYDFIYLWRNSALAAAVR